MLQHVNKRPAQPPLVLLHECEYMIRKTFCHFAAELNLAKVIETSEITQAKIKLSNNQFDMIILGFDDWLEELHIIQLIRSNMTNANKNIPIVAILPNITQSQVDELRELNVTEILLKPARIKTIQKAFINSINQI